MAHNASCMNTKHFGVRNNVISGILHRINSRDW